MNGTWFQGKRERDDGRDPPLICLETGFRIEHHHGNTHRLVLLDQEKREIMVLFNGTREGLWEFRNQLKKILNLQIIKTEH